MVLTYAPSTATVRLAPWPNIHTHPLQQLMDAAAAAAAATAAAAAAGGGSAASRQAAAAAAAAAAAEELLGLSCYDEQGMLMAEVGVFSELRLVTPADTAPANVASPPAAAEAAAASSPVKTVQQQQQQQASSNQPIQAAAAQDALGGEGYAHMQAGKQPTASSACTAKCKGGYTAAHGVMGTDIYCAGGAALTAVCLCACAVSCCRRHPTQRAAWAGSTKACQDTPREDQPWQQLAAAC